MSFPGGGSVDAEQIREFVQGMFTYASDDAVISLRVFDDGGGNHPLSIQRVRLNGEGLEPLIKAAVAQAQFAAEHPKRAVFCPPVCGFSSETSAKEDDLLEGYALTVECDQKPQEARERLEILLGPATLVVASGGLWLDPDTGELQPKLHLHWRLNEPATDGDLARLKQARRLATRLVGGDPSNVPLNHPIRWPGSVHRKGEPRLAKIIARSEHEIDLRDALEWLQVAQPEEATGPAAGEKKEPPDNKDGDPRSDHELIDNITSGREFHPSIVPLSARLLGRGMYPGAVVTTLRGLMEAIPSEKRDYRWQMRWDDVPRNVAGAEAKWGSHQRDETALVFDPWEKCGVPDFPFEILPPTVAEFVKTQSTIKGCDPSALAMAALVSFSAALDHRFTLKMMRHSDWRVSPRLWVLLVGDPSVKKTPAIDAATQPLEQHQDELRDEYEAKLEQHQRLVKCWDKKNGEPPDPAPPPPRFVVSDTTVEKLGEILSRYDRGLLVKRDEFSGFIGSLEKYGGSRGSAADRAFYLKSFDGGTFTVDRVSRGEFRIRNLSVSFIGGIQPARLAELHGLTSDGLLQRFIPVILAPAKFPQDIPSNGATEAYEKLSRKLVQAWPVNLSLTPEALDVMTALRRHLHDLEQVASGLADGFPAFLGKLAGLAGNLALILHMISGTTGSAIGKEIAEHVRRLVLDFILLHAFEFYRTADTVTDGDRLQRLASWILTSGQDRISSRDLMRNVRDMRSLALFELNKRVSPLVAGGWLTAEEPGPVCRSWRVSPAVPKQFAQRAVDENERKARLAELMNSKRKTGG